jgi:hypothetical protein
MNQKEIMKEYSFENLRLHSEEIIKQFGPILQKYHGPTVQGFDHFCHFLDEIELEAPSLQKNVRLLLACKTLNHVYSGIILTERGLLVDALACERNAIETILFHWLLVLDSSVAEAYSSDAVPRPVNVRKRLEDEFNVDLSEIKSIYAKASAALHVARKSEDFHLSMTSVDRGEVYFGGKFSPEDQAQMMKFLPACLYLFWRPLLKD